MNKRTFDMIKIKISTVFYSINIINMIQRSINLLYMCILVLKLSQSFKLKSTYFFCETIS